VRDARGFTLWELLWTLCIAGVLVGAGAPAFTDFLLDARQTADINAFVLAIQLARSEAAKRGRPVIVCGTADQRRCGTDERGLEAGFMVFVNLDDEHPPQRSAAEPLLYVHVPEIVGTITSNRAFYEIRPVRRSTNGTVVLCDRRGAPAARAVVVSYTGRPRVARRDGDGQPLRCADLT
jgi:type IV fimbrial biogenesis protein FimT